ncbi:MAG: ATP-binding cassette domain-containing protein [Candidatus Thorarchaeota archaeon]
MIPLIKLEKVFIYGERMEESSKPIVNDINLNIYPRDIVGIVGPSGAGKTTLVKGIALLNDHSLRGTYLYNNEQVLPLNHESILEDIRKKIIFIHQLPVLFKGSVRYNIEYGLRVRKMKIDENYLDELINSFSLENLLKRNIKTLSGGEKQRVCLLRALIIRPKVLILDEPTQNLDPANIKIIEQNIIKFRDRDEGTVIIVTHNLFQAQRVTEKLGILVNGQLIEFGKTIDMFSNPKNQKTEDFLSGKTIF